MNEEYIQLFRMMVTALVRFPFRDGFARSFGHSILRAEKRQLLIFQT
jgi:hypothetical protein